MPIIQLPRDTRWSELGQGISTGLQALVEGYQDKQASEGVAQIMEDPNIADTKKYSAALKQFGALGAQKYKEAITAQVLSASAQEKQAAALKDLAAVGAQTQLENARRILNGQQPLSTPTLGGVASPNVTPNAPSPTTPGAAAPSPPVGPSTPTSPTSVIPDVLGGTSPDNPNAAANAAAVAASRPNASPANLSAATASRSAPITVPPPNTSMMPSTAPAPMPPAAAQSAATVGALGGATTPTPIGGPTPLTPSPLTGPVTSTASDPISRMVENRFRTAGVTPTPAELADAILQTRAHAATATGLNELMAPVDKAIDQKRKGLVQSAEQTKATAEATSAAAKASTAEQEAAIAAAKNKQELQNLQIASQFLPETARASAAKLVAEAGIANRNYQQGQPYDVPLADLHATFPMLTEEQGKTLAVVGKVQGQAAFAKQLAEFVTTDTEAASKLVPAFVTQVAAIRPALISYEHTMDNLEQHPQMTGGPSAIAAGFLAKYGLPDFGMAPPEVLSQLATSEQLALQTLQGHQGLGGQYLVPFVSATMPSAAKSKIFSAVETNVKAEDYISQLSSLRTAYQAARMDTTQVDDALAAAQKLHDRTSTLWWTGASPGQSSKVFYKGREINPETWQPVQGGAKEYNPQENIRFGGDRSMSGADINKLARESGRTPEAVRAELAAKWGQ